MAEAQKLPAFDSPNYLLISKAFKVSKRNLDSAFMMWYEAKAKIANKPNEVESAYLFHIGAYLHRMKGNILASDSLAKLSLNLYQRQKDTLGLSMVYFELGNNYLLKMNLDTADLYFRKAYAIKLKLNEAEGLGIALSNMGTIQDYKGNYREAADLYYKSISYNKQAKNYSQLADTYHNLSIVQYNLGNIDEAIHYQHLAVSSKCEK